MHLEEDREQELHELVQRLDVLVPRDGAHVMMPGESDPHASVGNRIGFLRLGIEVLRGALVPVAGPDGAVARVTPHIDYLVPPDARTALDLCELDESIGARPPVESRLGAVGQIVAGIAATALVIAGLVLLARIWQWLFA